MKQVIKIRVKELSAKDEMRCYCSHHFESGMSAIRIESPIDPKNNNSTIKRKCSICGLEWKCFSAQEATIIRLVELLLFTKDKISGSEYKEFRKRLKVIFSQLQRLNDACLSTSTVSMENLSKTYLVPSIKLVYKMLYNSRPRKISNDDMVDLSEVINNYQKYLNKISVLMTEFSKFLDELSVYTNARMHIFNNPYGF